MNIMADQQLISNLIQYIEKSSDDEILEIRSKAIKFIEDHETSEFSDFRRDALKALKLIDEELNARDELTKLRSTYNAEKS